MSRSFPLLLCALLITASKPVLMAQTFSPAVNYGVGLRPYTIVSADFDKDGDFDLATAIGIAFSPDAIGWVKILKNDGSGTFTISDSLFIGDVPCLTSADFNNDGHIDLAASDIFTKRVYILLNNGTGSFTKADSFASGRGNYTNSLEPCAADLDRDGDFDLVVPVWVNGTATDSVSVFLNNGNAAFSGPVAYPVGNNPYSVISADLDHDNDSDLVVTNNGSTSVSVLLNNGNGTFAPRVDYSVGTNPQGVSLADFNGDGFLDLAAANAYVSTPYVSVFMGNGDGTFGPRVNYTGCRPHAIASADYDLDGDIDMAVANNECSSVSIFLNNGNGTFAPPFTLPAGTGTNHVVTRDFDGDGDLDLAAENFDNDGTPGSTVSVFINQTISSSVTILDTIYTPAGYPDTSLAATIFIPSPATAKGIGVVLTHGSSIPRLGAKYWCDTLAARGYVAMTIDYYDMGVVPYGLYPKPVRAFKTAVEFLRSNAQRFGITTGKVVAFGQSQGAIGWGQTIIWDNDDAYFGTDPAIDDHVDAAILLYGAYDMFNNLNPALNDSLTMYFSLDPSLRGTRGQCISNVSNITTPILLLHGTSDGLVPIYHSLKLRDSLALYGKVHQLVEFPAGHAFDANFSTGGFTYLGLKAKDSVLAFLDRVLPATSVYTDGTSQPLNFHLGQNYPNPFNPTTTIQFSIVNTQYTILNVYDVLGREIATLVNEVKRPGTYTVEWNAQGLPSGVYFYRLQAGAFVQTRKLLLLR